jgi:hypothetical protein
MKNKNELAKYDANILEKIGRDGDKFSLNDLWILAGSPQNKDPRQWQRLPQAEEYLKSVSKILNVGFSHIIKSKRGKGGGTYGIKHVVLEYAQYLDADLGVLVNEVFFQSVEEEKNPDLIVDRAINTYKRKGKNERWIAQRIQGKISRSAFTSTLASHGVEREGFRNCTNAIYSHLYGGGTNVIREKKNLPKTANIRDHMSIAELMAVGLAEALASEDIEKNDLRGNGKCELASGKASKIVANAVMEHNKQIKMIER